MHTGPQNIIDLDNLPESQWEIDSKAQYIYRDKLWTHQAAGCVLCAEADVSNVKAQTLRAHDETDRSFICLTHGELEEMPFLIQRTYLIKIGNYEKTGNQELKDTLLVPKDMPETERSELFARLITAAADVEQEDLVQE